MRLQQKDPVLVQRVRQLLKDQLNLLPPKDIKLAVNQHRQSIPLAILGRANILTFILARQSLHLARFLRVLDRGRRIIDSHAFMPELGQTAGIQTGTASQIEDSGGRALEQIIMNPVHMIVDNLAPAAGGVMFLRKMFGQHPSAEPRLVPGDIVPLVPGFGRADSFNQIQ